MCVWGSEWCTTAVHIAESRVYTHAAINQRRGRSIIH